MIFCIAKQRFMDQNTVFIIDDSPEIVVHLTRLLEKEKITVAGTAGDVKTAKSWLSTGSADCVILDIGLPDGSGFEILEWLSENNIQTRVIVFTNYYSEMIRGKALSLGAHHVLDKSADIDALLAVLDEVL